MLPIHVTLEYLMLKLEGIQSGLENRDLYEQLLMQIFVHLRAHSLRLDLRSQITV